MAAGCRGDASALGVRMKRRRGPRFSCGFLCHWWQPERKQAPAGREGSPPGTEGGSERGREGRAARPRRLSGLALCPRSSRRAQLCPRCARAPSALSDSSPRTSPFLSVSCFNCHSLKGAFFFELCRVLLMSQDCRIVRVGRRLWRSSHPSPRQGTVT